ncbi:cardiolipin synthase ClsB [Comamonadaceae bacterium G21597-S1]|nr:cardiolipin synthase ClsB [Comamonadaceae bacterium G21597-S1]
MKPTSRWIGGNRVQLLENGEAYFPAVFEAIEAAREEIVLETFILFEDAIGQQLHTHLLAAARRGVRVDVLVDGYGSCDLSPEFIDACAQAGVRLRVYDPARRVMGARFNVLRRMHRKIVVVDGRLAFVGGINFSHDHVREFGPQAKQDYAVRVQGPIVAHIHHFVRAQIDPSTPRPDVAPAPAEVADAARDDEAQSSGAEMIFVTRDNHRHRNAIERHYRAAIRGARESVVLANAYFFPGYLLLRQMRRAARRGVRVTLILQGEPDMPIVKTAASLLYDHLQSAGVQIYEYCERPLHGKVAVVDGRWATVGSSNLDPLSLVLNLEANLVIRDRDFAQHLEQRLEYLITEHCKAIEPDPMPVWTFWRPLRAFLLYHLLSGYSRWFSWLPRRAPKIHHATRAQASAAAGSGGHG